MALSGMANPNPNVCSAFPDGLVTSAVTAVAANRWRTEADTRKERVEGRSDAARFTWVRRGWKEGGV